MVAADTSAAPGARSAPAIRRTFVTKRSPLRRPTSNRPGPRGRLVVLIGALLGAGETSPACGRLSTAEPQAGCLREEREGGFSPRFASLDRTSWPLRSAAIGSMAGSGSGTAHRRYRRGHGRPVGRGTRTGAAPPRTPHGRADRLGDLIPARGAHQHGGVHLGRAARAGALVRHSSAAPVRGSGS